MKIYNLTELLQPEVIEDNCVALVTVEGDGITMLYTFGDCHFIALWYAAKKIQDKSPEVIAEKIKGIADTGYSCSYDSLEELEADIMGDHIAQELVREFKRMYF